MEIKQYLSDKGVKYREFKHPPVFTCKEAKKHKAKIKGIFSKNLFIKDRKSKKFYLVILSAEKSLDFKKLERILNDRLKFANPEDLKEILYLTPGSVSPFGLINDKYSKVKVLIDKDVWNSEFASFHPNINTETLELRKEDFHKYINSLKNKFLVLNL